MDGLLSGRAIVDEVEVVEKRLSDYREIIGQAAHAEILALASKLKGKRVAHVNATPYGGGVAELLHSVVPLLRDVGLDAHWFVLSGPKTFFEITKTLHNGLQGAAISLTPEMIATYRHVNETNAAGFQDDYDFVVVHDPQPAPFVDLCERKARWIWRCHLDLTVPDPSAIGLLSPYISAYDASIFSADAYVPSGVFVRKAFIAPPAIDPLSPKNRSVAEEERHSVLSRSGFDPGRPVISQVGRFDPWKDPLGVIDAYRIVKKEFPSVQLLLIGSMARDDPEGWLWFERAARHAGEDPDVHLLTDLRGVGALEVNVLQRETDVALAKSLREGFGLIVSESLWKRVPVVGGNATGIAMQIRDGRDGYLVSTVEEAAARTVELLRDEKRRKAMGKSGRERVHTHFLITRYLRDYLRLFQQLAA
ncbi:MAG: glycosyltransferase [Euryarchaeota archaeon]|nr:glycosyltransferase [Euryarchaeota archaeon]